MVGLAVVGLVAGFLAGISACILPVLPVVLVAGVTPTTVMEQVPGGGPPSGAEPARSRQRAGFGRPLAVIAGLVLSFSLLVLAGSEVLSLLHLPQDLLRHAGIVVLAVMRPCYLIPAPGAPLDGPFAPVGPRPPRGWTVA